MMKKIQVYLLTITVIVISLFVYFMLNFKQGIHIEETMITHSTIPARFSGTRLIQLSDTKIKTKKDLSLLKKTVEEINKLEADIVVFTGDLFEKGAISSDLSKQVKKTLSELNPSLAKVAVLGDTDLKQKKETKPRKNSNTGGLTCGPSTQEEAREFLASKNLRIT